MNRWTRPALLALAAIFALAPAAVAQEPPRDERFGERVDVTEVLLDVLVTDRQGNVIVGLKEDDFVVEEEGNTIDLTGVTFYSNRRLLESQGEAAAKGIDVGQPLQDRYFILFFDDQKDEAADFPQVLAQQIDAGREARQWVAKELLRNDWVAVVSYDKKLKVHTDFTRDRQALETAITNAVKGKDTDGNWPSRIKEGEGPSLAAGLPRGNELRDRTTLIYDGIRVLAEAAGKITGRKNLLLFTTGFGRVNSFGQYQPEPRDYPPMVQALNDNNVAVYAIDLVPPGTEHVMASAMNQLADETGGRYLFNFTSFASPLRQVTEETNGYYLLSYRATHPAGTKGYQKVTVRTTNPELRVRAREGYQYGQGETATASR